EITLRYAIDPRTLADERCGVTRCTTCDYLIHLVIHNVDDPEGTLDVPVRIPATACNEPEGFDTLITVTLDPGTYIFERKVESNTVDPNSVSEASPFGESYAESYRS